MLIQRFISPFSHALSFGASRLQVVSIASTASTACTTFSHNNHTTSTTCGTGTSRSHYSYHGPGIYSAPDPPDIRWKDRDFSHRGFTVGIGGPVGSGKTALVEKLCHLLPKPLAVVTNDIFTQEDADYLIRQQALPATHISAVETGGCPHAAIREDVSANLSALERLTATTGSPLLLCESGGDNLAANFSKELADYTVYVIDVAGGDKVPRKGGPGITQSDLLCINKIDLAPAVGASLEVMERDATKMRGAEAPTVFMSVKEEINVDTVVKHIMNNYELAMAAATAANEKDDSV